MLAIYSQGQRRTLLQTNTTGRQAGRQVGRQAVDAFLLLGLHRTRSSRNGSLPRTWSTERPAVGGSEEVVARTFARQQMRRAGLGSCWGTHTHTKIMQVRPPSVGPAHAMPASARHNCCGTGAAKAGWDVPAGRHGQLDVCLSHAFCERLVIKLPPTPPSLSPRLGSHHAH